MPRTTKDSRVWELEDERDDKASDEDAPRVDEIEPDERATSRLDDGADELEDDEDLVEDIDLDDLAAMEGPDA